MHDPQTEIILMHGGLELARVTVPPGEYVIGRGAEVEIRAETPLLSRRHARLTIKEDELLIEDLGSSNGTFVNDQPVNEIIRLFPDQHIRLGPDLRLEVRRVPISSEADASLSTPPPPVNRRYLPEELLTHRRYAIGHQIARGGMGAILDAKQLATQRTVAMKVMLGSAEEGEVLRFIGEAQVTAQLEHPNIVPVHELGVDEQDQVFYTMKMVRGVTLMKVLELLAQGIPETVEKYPLPALLTIFQKVCDAVAFAHSRGVIHRDLKPENIMLDDFGVVLVMDWGLAKVLKGHAPASPFAVTLRPTAGIVRTADLVMSGTLAGSIMGTPHYMSPEQARGEIDSLDVRSDIYSLGAILRRIITLDSHVTGRTVAEIIDKVGRGETEPITNSKSVKLHHLPGGQIPNSLAAVVRKAMSMDKAVRYSCVAELQRDMTAYQTGFATSAEKAGFAKQLLLLIRRHKVASLGLVAVLVVGTTFGTKAILEGRRANAALESLKKTAPALRQLAVSEAGFQRFESARQKLDAALALDPADLGSYWQRAWISIGMERWSEAIVALHAAAEKDPAHTSYTEIIPTLEALAAAPEAQRWTSDRALRLTRYLEGVSANGSLAALSAKLRLTAESKRKLVEARVKEWLGPNAGGRVQIQGPGLIRVVLADSGVDSLEPLRGLPIDQIFAPRTNVSDLEPLRGMSLSEVTITETKVTSLEPLRGMKLTQLDITGTKISDLSPIAGAPLRDLTLSASAVHDLSPLRGAPIEHFIGWNMQAVDFSPLSGAPVKEFLAGNTLFYTLSFLADSHVEAIIVGGGKIDDLSPLRGKPLHKLQIASHRIHDLSPLRGAPITDLMLIGNPVEDYSPLLDLPKLDKLAASGDAKNLLVLRHHPTLRFISLNESPYRPVADFWKEYEAQHPAEKK